MLSSRRGLAFAETGEEAIRGGGNLRRIVRLDLPRRLGMLPRPVTEVLTGIVISGAFVGLRLALAPLLGNIAPFALALLGMVLATLVAGWRSGLVAILIGIGIIWYLVLEPHGNDGPPPDPVASLVAACITAGLILLALALYQREVRAGEIDRQRRIQFLGHALREMDHRTKNNFQIVMSLLQLQANRSQNDEAQGGAGRGGRAAEGGELGL